MKISKGLKQSYALQDFCFDAAVAVRGALTTKDGKLTVAREDAVAIRSLIAAWTACQERIAFHRRVPSPGVLKPEPKTSPRKRMRVLDVDMLAGQGLAATTPDQTNKLSHGTSIA